MQARDAVAELQGLQQRLKESRAEMRELKQRHDDTLSELEVPLKLNSALVH